MAHLLHPLFIGINLSIEPELCLVNYRAIHDIVAMNTRLGNVNVQRWE